MKKTILTIIGAIGTALSLHAQSLNVSNEKLNYNYSNEVISENNFIIFRSKSNRIEINHPCVLGNNYEIAIDDAATISFKDGAFYLTPILEKSKHDNSTHKISKNKTTLKIIDKSTAKPIFEQTYTIINYPSSLLLVNDNEKIKLSDTEFKLSIIDGLTSEFKTIKATIITINNKSYPTEGQLLSKQASQLIKKLDVNSKVYISVVYESSNATNKVFNTEISLEK